MVRQLLSSGVVIVVSKASQRLYVFRDGALWQSSRVSTGKRGHATPSGVFAILQKSVTHRSNKYSNAPMPFMQRLTWSGIAMHAGHVPGFPSSHGCVRMPREFAQALYGITDFGSTVVIVTSQRVASERGAIRLAMATDAAVPMNRLRQGPQLRFAAAEPAVPVQPIATGPSNQTIQLAAASSPQEASAHWARLIGVRPDLARLPHTVMPARVAARQYYRLRVSAPGAHAVCSDLKRSGIDCFAVS